MTPEYAREAARRLATSVAVAKEARALGEWFPEPMQVIDVLRSLDFGPHKFASTQVQFHKQAADAMKEFAARIPDEILAEDGREDDPHITVKYGIHSDDPKPIAKLLQHAPPIKAVLGTLDYFDTDEADVLIIPVDSPDLHLLNTLISNSVKVTDTYPEYKPHATLAYLKKGYGEAFRGNTAFEGKTALFDSVTFATAGGQRTVLPLRAALRAAGGPGSGNFGHAGRPGEVGGSASEGGGKAAGGARDLSDEQITKMAREHAVGVNVLGGFGFDNPHRADLSKLKPGDRIAFIRAAHESDIYSPQYGTPARLASEKFAERAKREGWSPEKTLQEGLKEGHYSLEKKEGFKELSNQRSYDTDTVLKGLNERERDQIEDGLIGLGKDVQYAPDMPAMVSAGWTQKELERFADKVDAAGGRSDKWNEENGYKGIHDLAGNLAYHSKNYENFEHTMLGDWAMAGGTQGAHIVRTVSERAFPLEGDGQFFKLPKDKIRVGSDAHSPERVAEHLRTLKGQTEEFYQKKLDKELVLMRGVGGHAEAYTPGGAESWTKDKRTVDRFGKMMMGRDEKYSALETSVTYRDVLWSYESVKGKKGWPPDSELKGKKEFVLLGSRVKKVKVDHRFG